MMRHGMVMHEFGGIGILGSVLHILFIVLIVLLIVSLVRRSSMRHMYWKDMYGMNDKNSALSILKERYAKGEINKQEFEEKKKDLEA